MKTQVQTSSAGEGTGGRLVTADGRTLPLKSVSLRADAQGGVATVVLSQCFENPYDEPLRVTYLMPLPADGAVSGYAFTVGERRVVGEVDRKQKARERFERALAEGRSAGLVEQERSSLFTQELGNLPPRAQVVAELTIDQRLRWLDEGAWEWRFPTAAAPRYTGAPGRVPDAARTEIAVADAPLPARLSLVLRVRDRGASRKPESPVHALLARRDGDAWAVELSEEGGVRLDRDVVVRWAVAAPKVGVTIDVGRPAASRAVSRSSYGLMTLAPPAPGSAEARARARDLILLVDTSGSMGGEPLAQLKKVCAALVDSLGAADRLEMIEFSTAARRWQSKAVHADDKQRSAAKKWLRGLEAGGGTEMVSGVIEALAPLGLEAQRQVVLLTDGYIGFENEVVRTVTEKLPAGSRLHVVGVGSAVNRSLTAPGARAGRGVEVIVAPGEDPERAVSRLMARTAAPIVTDVEVRGSALRRVAPRRLPDLYAGSPSLASLELDPAGGELVVRGRTAFGTWEQIVYVAACEAGQGPAVAATLLARELVEDLEVERAAGGESGRIDAEVERLGLEFQIATRLTTWIAVSQEVTVDPSAPSRRELVPQELPHGVSAEGLGLRAGSASPAMALSGMAPQLMMPAAAPMKSMAMPGQAPPPPSAARPTGMLGRAAGAAGEAFRGLFKREEPADEAGEADEATAVRAPETLAEEAAGSASVEDGEAPAGAPAEPAPVDKQAKKRRAPAAPRPESKPQPLRRLRARLRVAANGELVLEIVLDAPMTWIPEAQAAIRFDDGSALGAVLDPSRSTRGGQLAAGQVARLALTHAPHGGRAIEVTLRIGGELVALEIDPA